MNALHHHAKRYSLNMLEGSLLDKIVLFALPFAVSSILQQLFNAADLAVVGRFASSEAMAATTVLCMATMLHSIAVGNMTPSFRVMPDGTVREIYFYCVDISEFTANKLSDRGSLSARGIVTNVQDFIVTLTRGLGL